MASDGHSLIFVGTDSEILSIQIGTLLLTSVFLTVNMTILNLLLGEGGPLQKLSIMKLNASSSGVRHYMAFDPVHRALYISLPIEKRVVQIRLDREGIVDEILPNFVGNGKSCLQLEGGSAYKRCGDGGAAGKAMLTYPKVRHPSEMNPAAGRSNGVLSTGCGCVQRWKCPLLGRRATNPNGQHSQKSN